MAHGGFIVTLVDNVTGLAAMVHGPWGVSVNINVNFAAPVRLGDKIIANAQLTRMGSSICHLAAKLVREKDGEVVATGTQALFVTELKSSTTEAIRNARDPGSS